MPYKADKVAKGAEAVGKAAKGADKAADATKVATGMKAAYTKVSGTLDEVSFAYTILGSLTSRKQGGKKVEFTYDTEEQLTAVINEKGEAYKFERDTKGNISQEIGFDGLTKTYERSQAGLVQKIKRPGERWTAYEHDPLGNVIRADYYDDTWETFCYDKNGLLVETQNEDVKVKLERDSSGQVIKEWQNDHWIASNYDELGSRLQVASSLGARAKYNGECLANYRYSFGSSTMDCRNAVQ